MLSDPYRQTYQIFQECLEQLQAQIQADSLELARFQTTFQEAQTQFQQKVLTLELTELGSAQASKVQSIQLEINKQLRLLSMDLLFLRTARQPATVQQRQAQMGDRLTLLKSYCTALLGDG